MGRGYSGNHPRYSRHNDEKYDAKQAYDKDLSASARLHYLENDREDHDSAAQMHCSPMNNNRADRLRGRAQKRSERSGAESGDYDYEDAKVAQMLAKAKMLDERSGANNKYPMSDAFGPNGRANMTTGSMSENQSDERSNELRDRELNDMMDNRADSPLDACAKDEGGSGCVKEMGGAWRVISNKTDKPWPAKYANKSKAEAALRGYHAG